MTCPPYIRSLFHDLWTFTLIRQDSECFRSVYEDLFYLYGVDFIISGHVHAYERTHPMYKYELDNCGPVWLTIGDGGNVEGPYRNFVDEINPATNKTYCEGMKSHGNHPNEAVAKGTSWPPFIQEMVRPRAGCCGQSVTLTICPSSCCPNSLDHLCTYCRPHPGMSPRRA